MYHLQLKKLHEYEKKHLERVNILKYLPLAKNLIGM